MSETSSSHDRGLEAAEGHQGGQTSVPFAHPRKWIEPCLFYTMTRGSTQFAASGLVLAWNSDEVLEEKIAALSKYLVADTYGNVQVVLLGPRCVQREAGFFSIKRIVFLPTIQEGFCLGFGHAVELPFVDKLFHMTKTPQQTLSYNISIFS